MEQHGTTFQEALWATRAGNVFTTHTPVPAGFDTFASAEIREAGQYFDDYVQQPGRVLARAAGAGRRNPDDAAEPSTWPGWRCAAARG